MKKLLTGLSMSLQICQNVLFIRVCFFYTVLLHDHQPRTLHVDWMCESAPTMLDSTLPRMSPSGGGKTGWPWQPKWTNETIKQLWRNVTCIVRYDSSSHRQRNPKMLPSLIRCAHMYTLSEPMIRSLALPKANAILQAQALWKSWAVQRNNPNNCTCKYASESDITTSRATASRHLPTNHIDIRKHGAISIGTRCTTHVFLQSNIVSSHADYMYLEITCKRF